MGLMQVMPETAKDPGFGVEPLLDPYDPVENVRFGQQYIAAMLKRYGNDQEAALIAYNAGPANADKWIKSGRNYASLPQRQETEPYARKIMEGFNG
jgi:soluble lytic murein transglycosylase-like protein